LSRDKKVSLSGCPFVPGQEQQETNPGQTLLSRDIPGQKKMSKKVKNCKKKFFFQKLSIFLLFFPSVPWLSRDIPGWDGTGCQNPGPARPVAKYQNSVLARSMSRF
jgi:hypothetical protein